jgi:hypothetical protein
VIRGTDGTWRAAGAGNVAVWVNGKDVPLDRLP